MRYFAGIDAGSTYVKAAVIDENKRLAGFRVSKTGINANSTALKIMDELAEEIDIAKDDICSIIATGYGRRIIEPANESVTEIKAHAAGVRMSCPDGTKVKTVIDIGGQDSKVIVLDDSRDVENFVMNDKCAAGTGRFFEALARTLDIDVGDFSHISLKARSPCRINSLCVVFAESEVISLLARGKDLPDIVAGIHESMAKRIANMARKTGMKEEVVITGGGGLNPALVEALSCELMTDIITPEHPQMNGAFGAALLAFENAGIKKFKNN